MNGLTQAQTSIKMWNRIERDENGLQHIIQCIDTKLINPFDISQSKGEKMPLINIATRTVAPSKFRNLYSPAKEQGEKAMGAPCSLRNRKGICY